MAIIVRQRKATFTTVRDPAGCCILEYMRWLVLVVFGSSCGRIGFELEPRGDSNSGGDGADSGGNGPALSCTSLAATCGPTGNGSCCESLAVTGGTFFRGYDGAADMMYTDMTRPATVGSFRLDRYEVTVGRFRKFVTAGLGTQASPPPAGAGARTLNGMANQGGWDPAWTGNLAASTPALIAALTCDAMYRTWTEAPGASESRPITCITWYEAMAFCAWDGGFLPTEAESMYAASGGSQQRAYPWSSPADSTSINCLLTNYGGANWPTTACVGAGANNVGSVSPAGDGLWGQADLGGNAWEWGLDWYVAPLPSPCTDCANLVPATYRLVRGGSFRNDGTILRAGYRLNLFTPADRVNLVGVRCARTP